MTMHLERLEKMIRGEVQPPPIAHLIGFRLTQVQKGEAVVEFEARQQTR